MSKLDSKSRKVTKSGHTKRAKRGGGYIYVYTCEYPYVYTDECVYIHVLRVSYIHIYLYIYLLYIENAHATPPHLDVF